MFSHEENREKLVDKGSKVSESKNEGHCHLLILVINLWALLHIIFSSNCTAIKWWGKYGKKKKKVLSLIVSINQVLPGTTRFQFFLEEL